MNKIIYLKKHSRPQATYVRKAEWITWPYDFFLILMAAWIGLDFIVAHWTALSIFFCSWFESIDLHACLQKLNH